MHPVAGIGGGRSGWSNSGGSSSSGSSSNRRAGSLTCDVLKVSGAGFSSDKVRVVVSLGGRRQRSEYVKYPFSLVKKRADIQLALNQRFAFDLAHPTDFLTVTCYTGTGDAKKPDICVGRVLVALNHLPVGTASTKWYELKPWNALYADDHDAALLFHHPTAAAAGAAGAAASGGATSIALGSGASHASSHNHNHSHSHNHSHNNSGGISVVLPSHNGGGGGGGAASGHGSPTALDLPVAGSPPAGSPASSSATAAAAAAASSGGAASGPHTPHPMARQLSVSGGGGGGGGVVGMGGGQPIIVAGVGGGVVQLRITCQLDVRTDTRNSARALTALPRKSVRPVSALPVLRFVDYFLVVGCDTPLPQCCGNGNDRHQNRPRVLERYPPRDRPEFALPDSLPLFCFPSGYELSPGRREPHVFAFRQTWDVTKGVYGVCLVYWTPIAIRSHYHANDDHTPEPSPRTLPGAGGAGGAGGPSSHHPPHTLASPPLHAQPHPQLTNAQASLAQALTRKKHELSPKPPAPLAAAVVGTASGSSSGGAAAGHGSGNGSGGGGGSSSHKYSEAYVPTALVLVSRMPYIPQLRQILTTLYQRFVLPPNATPHHHAPAPPVPPTPAAGAAAPAPTTVAAAANAAGANTAAMTCTSPVSCTAAAQQLVSPLPHHSAAVAFSVVDDDGRSLEQYLTFVCDEIPLPGPGPLATVSFHLPAPTAGPTLGLGGTMAGALVPFTLALPASELDLPLSECSLLALFQVLELSTVLSILGYVLTEHKIVFHSRQRALLLFVTEAILSLCFPFTWPHIFIPVLPSALAEVLDAPVPYIVGVHTDDLTDWDRLASSDSHIAVVDIDRSDVECSVPAPPFPAANVRVLTRAVRKFIRPGLFDADRMTAPPLTASSIINATPAAAAGERGSASGGGGGGALAFGGRRAIAAAAAERERDRQAAEALDVTVERRLRVEFLTFTSSLLEGYRNFLAFIHAPPTDAHGHEHAAASAPGGSASSAAAAASYPVFDTPAYLDQHPHLAPFVNRFLQTQIFSEFAEKHVYQPNFLDDYLLFAASTNLDATPLPALAPTPSHALVAAAANAPPLDQQQQQQAAPQRHHGSGGPSPSPPPPLPATPQKLTRHSSHAPLYIPLPDALTAMPLPGVPPSPATTTPSSASAPASATLSLPTSTKSVSAIAVVAVAAAAAAASDSDLRAASPSLSAADGGSPAVAPVPVVTITAPAAAAPPPPAASSGAAAATAIALDMKVAPLQPRAPATPVGHRRQLSRTTVEHLRRRGLRPIGAPLLRPDAFPIARIFGAQLDPAAQSNDGLRTPSRSPSGGDHLVALKVSRLQRVVTDLLSIGGRGAANVDVTELSSVVELLSYAPCRTALVDILEAAMRSPPPAAAAAAADPAAPAGGAAAATTTTTDTPHHKRVDARAFQSLSLLVNVAIEESFVQPPPQPQFGAAAPPPSSSSSSSTTLQLPVPVPVPAPTPPPAVVDFETATALLGFAQRLYTDAADGPPPPLMSLGSTGSSSSRSPVTGARALRGAAPVSPSTRSPSSSVSGGQAPAAGAAGAAAAASSSSSESKRTYLVSVIRAHPLWRNDDFWDWACLKRVADATDRHLPPPHAQPPPPLPPQSQPHFLQAPQPLHAQPLRSPQTPQTPQTPQSAAAAPAPAPPSPAAVSTVSSDAKSDTNDAKQTAPADVAAAAGAAAAAAATGTKAPPMAPSDAVARRENVALAAIGGCVHALLALGVGDAPFVLAFVQRMVTRLAVRDTAAATITQLARNMLSAAPPPSTTPSSGARGDGIADDADAAAAAGGI